MKLNLLLPRAGAAITTTRRVGADILFYWYIASTIKFGLHPWLSIRLLELNQ
jgi:hypothetical protein